METKRCEHCERDLDIKRFAFVKVDGVAQRDVFCRICSRTTKHCGMCDRTLPKSAFYSDKSRPDGKASRCRECAKAYKPKRRRKDCDRCGEPLPPKTKAQRCRKCHSELARQSVVREPWGIMFPGLAAMRRPSASE